MIRITVELVSAVHPSRNKVLGVAEIVNDGTGGKTTGNYLCTLSKAGSKTGETWKRTYVRGFPRTRLGGWDLLYRVLSQCVGFRN